MRLFTASKSPTLLWARYWQGQIGALKAGYFADVIAVPGDPLQDISVMQKVSFVMKGGVVYRR